MRENEPPTPAGAEDTSDAVFEALWKRVLEAWDDDKPHAALLEHALREGKLPEAAGRYRALKDDAEKAARAQKKLDGIVIAATQLLMATKSPPRAKTPWWLTAIAAVVALAIISWVSLLVFRRR